FIFRSFYAFRNMSRSDGFPTNVLHMVGRLILRLLREEKPRSLAFIMDGKGPNFRHERFAGYKAQRPPTPEPLVRQIEPLKELLGLLGVPVLVSEGCEADDCIASLAFRLRATRTVVIVGADKDLRQCLHENVLLWDPAAKDEKITTLDDFRAEYGMAPSSWPDYQALVGDSSDNIPGVAKVGSKTAGELIKDFSTLEELFDRLAAVTPKVRLRLEGQRDNAMLYRELTRLRRDACPETGEADLDLARPESEPLIAFMVRYEMRALAREVESMVRAGLLKTPRPVPQTAGKPSPLGPPPRPAPNGREEAAPTPRAGGLLAGKASGPQTAPATENFPAAGPQASLFAPAAPLTSADPGRFIKAFAPEELPPPAGADALALLPLEAFAPKGAVTGEGLLVAAADWERLYSGPPEALAAFLKGTADREQGGMRLVTSDFKGLCKRYPALASLPVGRFFDCSLAAYLLSPEDRGYAFPQLAARWGEIAGSANAPHEHPGLLGLDIYRSMAAQLEGAGLVSVFTGLEMPLAPILARMEERGVRIDKAVFAAFLDEVQVELDGLTVRIHELAGRVFNVRSSQQLSDVLFSVLALPKSGKTRGGAVSTSQEALEKLVGQHPIVEAILEYRKLEKLRSTYLEPLPKLADENDRIHSTFNQTATATGRLSSSNPNLQNIPVRGAFGLRMRGGFTAAPGKLLVSADYSQIELRVLAHLSGDPTLLEAFRNNEDIHARTAGLLFDKTLEQVTPDMRRNAKTINFGLIYGMGAQKLAQELGIGMKEAKAFIDRYFERLGKLKRFYEAIEADALEHGFVMTMAGRRRLTPDISSQNNQLRSQARRQAINTRIQGSAADIIKLAMIAVERDEDIRRTGARLILQIHDELMLEAPAEGAEAAGRRLAAIMAGVNPGDEPLSVPLLVDWGMGPSWGDAQ
ncbi:MAG: DNA polymerase I, partial [Desulfovibrio sp.]|nr:DNA polymerase I [Desulfovibrio sp.]